LPQNRSTDDGRGETPLPNGSKKDITPSQLDHGHSKQEKTSRPPMLVLTKELTSNPPHTPGRVPQCASVNEHFRVSRLGRASICRRYKAATKKQKNACSEETLSIARPKPMCTTETANHLRGRSRLLVTKKARDGAKMIAEKVLKGVKDGWAFGFNSLHRWRAGPRGSDADVDTPQGRKRILCIAKDARKPE